MKHWSLATRIVSSVLSVVTVSLLALSMAVAGFTRYEITERLDNSLQEVSERLQATTVTHLQGPRPDNVAWVPDVGPRTLAYQVVDRSGHVVLRSQNAPVQPFVADMRTGFANTPTFRVYVAAPTTTAYRVLVGEPNLHRRGATWRATAMAVVPILVFLPVIWVLVRLIVRRALRPLDRLHDEMQSRGSGNLRPIASLDLPVELISIQHAVNTLLSRLETALSTERAFAASAAHELRNPIAALLAQAQVLETAVAPDPALVARVRVITTRTRRLGRTVEKLLQFSRASSGMAFRRERVDLLPIVHILIDDMDPPARDSHRIEMDTADMKAFIIHGDMDALGILFRNLIENALIHSAPSQPVRLTLERDGRVLIANDCAPLPPSVAARLTNPFVRGATRVQGSGLGLAIANNIARQMDAELRIASPVPGSSRGFVVSVRFPAVEIS
ncbi:two-component sensor histidine kinase [Komagataeibacter rhaeticus]|uniref:sensor histidine kinase n=2 Tax=Komagataeibacter rhaeticus TaxID=215221 RepID=UPI0004D70379|nr:HAMP domain-containing sensor histidine kinase [Komagataeibacter rhaeticus]KDU96011.1 histidine kinase [Komagataeibacter rhaeticus AF1]PYD52867.1 two-component sensor histidine kinase [Komagataeibacter rhaeticus]GBQ09464.1 two component sensor histidine kinase [Komagataeibacter rhaeticus DSM 16663]